MRWALLGEAEIGRHDDRILEMRHQVLSDVLDEHVRGGQHIARNGEEALHLACVRVQRDVAVGTCDFDHVGHEAGGDGYARLVLLVRAPVAQVWDDSGDARGRIQPQGLQRDEQLHEVVMDRPGGLLDDIHILPAHAVRELDEDILVGELDQLAIADR
jgi:hypothetical protein